MKTFKQFEQSMFENTYKRLAHHDVTKRGGARVGIFLDKIKDGKPFMSVKGDVIIDPSELEAFAQGFQTRGFSKDVKVRSLNGQEMTIRYPRDFFKDPDLGGEDRLNRIKAENAALNDFNNKLEQVLGKEGSPTIKVKIAGRVVECAAMISVPATPKADFAIIDMNQNPVAFISHKDGSKPSHFQQYGGLSHTSFANNPGVKKFMEDLQKEYPEGFQPRQAPVFRDVKDKNVELMSIYGVNYGSAPGINNCDEFHQGLMTLKPVGKGVYTIESTHKGTNGDIPPAGSGYECVYFARYTGDRGATIAGVSISHARIGVFPRAGIPSTSKEI